MTSLDIARLIEDCERRGSTASVVKVLKVINERLDRMEGQEKQIGCKGRPARGECEWYAKQLGMPDGEGGSFWDFYESKGWKVGKVPMKNWRAAMANWKRSHEERSGGASKGQQLGAWALESKLKAIEERMLFLRKKHGYEDAFGFHWENGVPSEYAELKKDRDTLKAQLRKV